LPPLRRFRSRPSRRAASRHVPRPRTSRAHALPRSA
jgi:hypothetical protein